MKMIPLLAMMAACLTYGLAAAQVDHSLLNQVAAQRGAARPQNADLSAAERRARAEVAVSRIKLDLVLARKALAAGAHRDAALRALGVLSATAVLPHSIDADEWELQAEGILARAKRAGVDVSRLRRAHGALVAGQSDEADDPQAQAAAHVARQYSGAPRDTVDRGASAATLRERASQRQIPEDLAYQPAKGIIDVEAVLERDRQRLYYEDVLKTQYKSDEFRRLVEADEARVAPDQEVTYPADWPERIKRREKNAGGQIARSRSWADEDGNQWYAGVYEVNDLTYNVPDFRPPFSMFLSEQLRDDLDRDALRHYSEIFNGYPQDLAAGIPLLRFFGGVDDIEYAGPTYSAQKQAEIVTMINAFTQQLTESKVISVGP